jgi:hypothetical protein
MHLKILCPITHKFIVWKISQWESILPNSWKACIWTLSRYTNLAKSMPIQLRPVITCLCRSTPSQQSSKEQHWSRNGDLAIRCSWKITSRKEAGNKIKNKIGLYWIDEQSTLLVKKRKLRLETHLTHVPQLLTEIFSLWTSIIKVIYRGLKLERSVTPAP